MSRITATGFAAAAFFSLGMLSGGCPLGTGGGTGTGGSVFNIPPTPIITTDVNRGVAPVEIQFGSDRSSDDGLIVKREWDFGDGSTSLDISPKHTFTQTGEFNVTLTLTDDDGATSTRTVTILVTEAPVPVISADRTVVPTAPGIVNFSAAGSFDPDGTIVEYRWDFGDSTVELLQDVAHQFSSPGNFKVTLTVTDDVGIQESQSIFVQVGIPQPTMEIRVPDSSLTNLVVSRNSPLWIQAVYSVDSSVERFITAGLDGDRDPCEAQYAIFAVSTGGVSRRIVGHADRVTRATYTPNGSQILSSSADGTVRITSASNGALVRSINLGNPVNAVAVAPGGSTFAAGLTNGNVVLCDLATGTTLRTYLGHTGSINDVRFSAAGTEILSGATDRRAILWNVSDGTILRDFVHTLAVNAVAFNPFDPAIIATACQDQTVQIWNSTSGENLRALTGHTGPVESVQFNADGTRLYSGGGGANLVIVFNPNTGELVGTFTGHTAAVISLDLSADGKTLLSGGAEGTVRVWNTDTRQTLRTSTPCVSPINSVEFTAGESTALVGIGARNQVKLDTNPPNGGDLNLTYPVALSLVDTNFPNGEYFLWTELDTNRTTPVRTYAAPAINVIDDFASDPTAGSIPRAPLINDEATILFPALSFGSPDTRRQVVDLGPLSAGDRVHLALTTGPGFGDIFSTDQQYSMALLDDSQAITAWYQQRNVLNAQGVVFTPESRLIIGHASTRNLLVMDGGFGAKVRIERATGQNNQRQQVVLVDFDGSGGFAVNIANTSGIIPPLNAADIDPTWTGNETALMKQAVLQRMNAVYAPYNIAFFSSDNPPTTSPRLRMYIGGSSQFSLGLSDYVDPRNETLTGSGVAYATSIGLSAIANEFANPVSTPTDVGLAIGMVAAHELGHLLGLRHVQNNPSDIMLTNYDPTLGLSITASEVEQDEQLFDLPSLGVQDAATLLLETIGPSN